MFGLNWTPFERSADTGSSSSTPTSPGGLRKKPRPRIGVALGAGAARGWSHIGVMQELEARRVPIDFIAGTSIGAVVGGCFAAGRLAALEAFARSLTKRRVFSLMDVTFSGVGVISGGKLRDELVRELADRQIEQLPIAFGAVATEIGLGHEVWLRKGDLVQSIRASYALPGVFEPVRLDGRWLFDGALVNPVPVTLCRAMGADIVIAVNLIGDTAYRGAVIGDLPHHSTGDAAPARETATGKDPAPAQNAAAAKDSGGAAEMTDARRLHRQFGRSADGAPGIGAAMLDAFNISQDRIARSRLAGDPPDVLINARLSKVGLFEFHRADELIAMGREAARRALAEIAEITAIEEELHS